MGGDRLTGKRKHFRCLNATLRSLHNESANQIRYAHLSTSNIDRLMLYIDGWFLGLKIRKPYFHLFKGDAQIAIGMLCCMGGLPASRFENHIFTVLIG